MRADPEPSANALVRRARAFVARQATASFHGTTTVSGGGPRSPVGPAETPLAQITGELVNPRRTHAVISDSAGAVELVMVSPAVYTRAADEPSALAHSKYVRADKQPSRLMRVRAEQARAFDVVALLAAATHSKQIDKRRDAFVIESDLAPRVAFGAPLGTHVQWATLRLLVTDDGTVRGLRLVTRAEANTTTFLEFGRWGERDITVAAPAVAAVDTAGPIATAHLASFKTAPLLMPRSLPSRWELVRAQVLAGDDTEEGCAQAELAYEDVRHARAGYLYLYEFPRSCAQSPNGAATPFRAGNYTGFSASAEGPYVQITVGKTIVQALSDMSRDELARTLSALVPLAIRSS